MSYKEIMDEKEIGREDATIVDPGTIYYKCTAAGCEATWTVEIPKKEKEPENNAGNTSTGNNETVTPEEPVQPEVPVDPPKPEETVQPEPPVTPPTQDTPNTDGNTSGIDNTTNTTTVSEINS